MTVQYSVNYGIMMERFQHSPTKHKKTRKQRPMTTTNYMVSHTLPCDWRFQNITNITMHVVPKIFNNYFSNNSEAYASELPEEMFIRYW